jgi:hypothetical protein
MAKVRSNKTSCRLRFHAMTAFRISLLKELMTVVYDDEHGRIAVVWMCFIILQALFPSPQRAGIVKKMSSL